MSIADFGHEVSYLYRLNDVCNTIFAKEGKHTSWPPARAIKRDALSEEHHFFIVPVPNDMEVNFCEDRPDQISVVRVSPSDLLDLSITPFDDLREFYTQHIIPRI